MNRSARLAAFAGAALIGVLLLVAGYVPGGLELHITRVHQAAPLVVLPLEPGERFTLHYYHSVENAPIWEVHTLDKAGRIYIEEERYLKFGAGMGRMPGVGRMVRSGPYEVIENMHMPTGDFVLRVGSPGVAHTVIWRGIQTNLSERVAHQAVRFSARPVSRLYKVYRTLFPHPTTPDTSSGSRSGLGQT
ncbi:MAG: DUF1850 domain-containing protein [Desulfatiglandaceae bacterium]